jgi:hypothetical protein
MTPRASVVDSAGRLVQGLAGSTLAGRDSVARVFASGRMLGTHGSDEPAVGLQAPDDELDGVRLVKVGTQTDNRICLDFNGDDGRVQHCG